MRACVRMCVSVIKEERKRHRNRDSISHGIILKD